MRLGFLAVGIGLIATLLAPTGAGAQRRDDWYRDVRPYLGLGGEEAVRRVRLWEEFIRLRTEVRDADRRGDISLRDADRFYDRLDRVGRFLRDDKKLSDSEYKRRRGDLDSVGRDLDERRRDRSSTRSSRRDSRW